MITRSCILYMQSNQIFYQTKQSTTLEMALPTSNLVKTRGQVHQRRAAASSQESDISVGTTCSNSTENKNYQCRMTMAIVRDLYSMRSTVDIMAMVRDTLQWRMVLMIRRGSVRYCLGRRQGSLFMKCVRRILLCAYAWGGWPQSQGDGNKVQAVKSWCSQAWKEHYCCQIPFNLSATFLVL